MHDIHSRWRQTSQESQDCLHSLAMEKREVMLMSLLKNRQKRIPFKLKKKYICRYDFNTELTMTVS